MSGTEEVHVEQFEGLSRCHDCLRGMLGPRHLSCFIGIKGVKFKKDHLCGACEAGKMTREKHPSKTIMTTTQPFELLHMDLFGPTHYSTLLLLLASMASSLLMITLDILGCT